MQGRANVINIPHLPCHIFQSIMSHCLSKKPRGQVTQYRGIYTHTVFPLPYNDGAMNGRLLLRAAKWKVDGNSRLGTRVAGFSSFEGR